jgi:hypothetical protein
VQRRADHRRESRLEMPVLQLPAHPLQRLMDHS